MNSHQASALALRERLRNPPNGRGVSDERTEVIPAHMFERRRIALETENAEKAKAERLRDEAEQAEEARRAFADFHLRCRIEQALDEHLGAQTASEVKAAEVEEAPPKLPLIVDIQKAVCEFYGVSRVDILSERRTAHIVLPRQIAVYLSRQLTLRSLPEIGRRFGGRDHTTCISAFRKIQRLLECDRELADEISEIKQRLGA
jgi:chromosomal replication initiation ATPase DnaA